MPASSQPADTAAAASVLSHEADFRLTRHPHATPDSQTTKWWSVLLTIEGSIEAFIARAERFRDDRRHPPEGETFFVVPVAYDRDDRRLHKAVQPVAIYARQDFLHALNRRPEGGSTANRYGVRALLLGALTPRACLDFDAAWPETDQIEVADDAVVMAVIDDGIGIANNLFRRGPVATRVEFAALLGATSLPRMSQTTIGRTLSRREIDVLLRDCTFNGLLDEDLFYARTGQADFYGDAFSTVALRASHGTHVMGLAAGYPMQEEVDDRPIICAALPARLVEDTTGVELLPALYLSFHMLMKQARRFRTVSGDLAPVMFNLSYGNAGGPHDGTGPFAELFDYYFAQQDAVAPEQKAWLTLAAGNLNLGRMHGETPAGGGETTLDLFVQPDDRTATLVQIWMPHARQGHSEVAEIGVSTPFGDSIAIITEGRTCASLLNAAGREIARLSYAFTPAPVKRGLVILSLNPSASLDADEPLAPCGTWTLRLRRPEDAADQIQAWIRRDETLPGFKPGGRQAYFNNDDYVRFGPFGRPLPVDPDGTGSPVRRALTLSGYACGQSSVTVAAFCAKQGELSDYSAAGPLNEPASEFAADRRGPDLTGRGDDSLVLRGVLGAGSRSGTVVRQGGTSSASPQMARAAAEAIATPGLGARDWAKNPLEYGKGLVPVRLCGPATTDRAGSGAYDLRRRGTGGVPHHGCDEEA